MKIAFLGTGLMGRPMASRLLQAGYEVVAYNRTKVKAFPLESIGAKLVDQPEEAIELASVIILMLADFSAIQAVLFPTINQIKWEAKTIIQMGTISSQQSLSLKEEIEKRDGEYLEAPVLGSIAEAEKGELVVLVGATQAQFERWLSLLRCFSPEPVYVGAVGQAATFKLALNQLIASLTASFAFSLGLIKKKGIALDLFMQVLRRSSLYAYHFDKKLDRMWEENYTNPTFPLRLLYKDVNLMIEEGREVGLEVETLSVLSHLLGKAMDQGWGERDYTALSSIILGRT
ncbi:MAG: NAD(P)-dependent oxidoreductase [Candidatus Aminicenantes bacterium]|nr:NAD(P)-dependent oxidoreductase [Candidatus Aminicenantes bacterium]